jgi:peptide deformylase
MKETELKIKVLGNGVLRRRASRIKEITPDIKLLLSRMSRLMYESSGVGLAAPQIGVSLSAFVADAGNGLYKIINPQIIKREGERTAEEGCLSVPGVFIKVKRAKKILLKAIDEEGKNVLIEAEDLLACVFQHEIDHLKGKLIVDYASLLDKIRIKRKLSRIKLKSKNELSQPKRECKGM